MKLIRACPSWAIFSVNEFLLPWSEPGELWGQKHDARMQMQMWMYEQSSMLSFCAYLQGCTINNNEITINIY